MRALTLLSFFFCSGLTFGQHLSKEYQTLVSNFITSVKSDNKEAISEMLYYPFGRQYPIPSIRDKREFLKRYGEIFNDTLKRVIVNSNPATDWVEMGWRGIMLGRGEVWIDFNGKLRAINYQSNFERRKRIEIIELERKTLHPSLSKYKQPICILETKKFRVRIDDLSDGYRYASWPINKTMSEKPDLILMKGEMVWEGSGGNHHFIFKNEEYTYKCQIIVLGTDESPPARLEIYKGEKEILSQDAKLFD